MRTRAWHPSGEPDLFGEVAAAEARAARWREWIDNPQPCPQCGLTERSGFAITNSHVLGYTPDNTKLYTDECAPMWLSINHVKWWFNPDVVDLTGGQLARDAARMREVWQHHPARLRARLAEHGIDLDALP